MCKRTFLMLMEYVNETFLMLIKKKGRWRDKADRERREEKLIEKPLSLVGSCDLWSWDIQMRCDQHVPVLSDVHWINLVPIRTQELLEGHTKVCPVWWSACEHGQEPSVRTGQTNCGPLEKAAQHPTVCTDCWLQTRWNFWFSLVAAFSRLLVHGNGIY